MAIWNWAAKKAFLPTYAGESSFGAQLSSIKIMNGPYTFWNKEDEDEEERNEFS
jgi:hypothetical protein